MALIRGTSRDHIPGVDRVWFAAADVLTVVGGEKLADVILVRSGQTHTLRLRESAEEVVAKLEGTAGQEESPARYEGPINVGATFLWRSRFYEPIVIRGIEAADGTAPPHEDRVLFDEVRSGRAGGRFESDFRETVIPVPPPK